MNMIYVHHFSALLPKTDGSENINLIPMFVMHPCSDACTHTHPRTLSASATALRMCGTARLEFDSGGDQRCSLRLSIGSYISFLLSLPCDSRCHFLCYFSLVRRITVGTGPMI